MCDVNMTQREHINLFSQLYMTRDPPGLMLNVVPPKRIHDVVLTELMLPAVPPDPRQHVMLIASDCILESNVFSGCAWIQFV